MSHPRLDFTALESFHREQTVTERQPAIIFYTPNTYHYTLLNLHNLEKNLFLIQQRNDLMTAEISEDVFGIVPVMNYHKNPGPVNQLADRILSLQDKMGIQTLSIGTGADFYSVMQITGGYFDGPESRKKAKWQLCINFLRIAEYLGITMVNGHRVVTIQPENFKSVRLGSLGSVMGKENLDLASFDPATELTGAEAKSLELGINIQSASKTVSSSTELMYQAGMEPCTVQQMKRFLCIMQANSDKPVIAHMDTGHIAAYGKDKKPEDYDIMAYTDVKFPRWAVHFNALYKNEHRMPTEENIAKDLAARSEKPDPVRSPYPELYGNVYDWLRETVNTSCIVQVSPEPKPEDLERLISEVGECWSILKKEYTDSHIPHPKYKGLLIPKKMFDEFVKKFG